MNTQLYVHIRPTIILSDKEVENEATQFENYIKNGGCGSFELWLQARFYGKEHTKIDRLSFNEYTNGVIVL